LAGAGAGLESASSSKEGVGLAAGFLGAAGAGRLRAGS
jgi:hypothetical protein